MKFKNILLAALLAAAGGLTTVNASEITPAGVKLAAELDSMHVDKLWLAGRQVEWRSGEPYGKSYTNITAHTHCSAFAAAAAEKVGIYLLRPPEHSATLLANAQQDWLSKAGTNQGWYAVKSPLLAQQLANEGEFVVVTCKNPDPTHAGHIAIVRPSVWADDKILSDGPEITQAGAKNYLSASTKQGFKNHPGAFENGDLLYFAHPLPASKLALQNQTASDQLPASK